MNWELFAAFLLITMILVVTPGPIVTLVIATGAKPGHSCRARHRRRYNVRQRDVDRSHSLRPELGAAQRRCAVRILRWAGAAYLVWLGIQTWRHASRSDAVPAPSKQVNFWRGFVVAMSNPKTIAFFTAFLPQFVDPSLPAEPQLAVMCTVAVALAACSDAAWAVAAGLGRTWFMQAWRAKMLGRCSAAALIGGGVWLSLTRRPA